MSGWHILQGSSTLRQTFEGTFPTIYLLIALRDLWASARASLLIVKHLSIISKLLSWSLVVSSVRHLSEDAFSRMWHVSSTKPLEEQKPVIVTILRQSWRHSNCLISFGCPSDSARIESCLKPSCFNCTIYINYCSYWRVTDTKVFHTLLAIATFRGTYIFFFIIYIVLPMY